MIERRAALLMTDPSPPQGIVGWIIVVDGRPTWKETRHDAIDYATRMHAVAWPVCVCKRKTDIEDHRHD